MWKKCLNFLERNNKAILIIILILNFTLRLIIYFTTKLFYFSDFTASFDAIELIHSGKTVPFYSGGYSYLNSYFAYFFKYTLGNLDYYFIVNSFFGTIATFIVYRIVIALKLSRVKGLIAAIVLSVYTEFMVFSSVLYTPILMVTILGLVILFSIRFAEKERFSIKYLICITVLVVISLFLKRELLYIWGLYLVFAFMQLINRNKQLAKRFLILSIVLFFSITTISTKIILNGNEALKRNSFLMFAHTWYGGDGGKAQITYPEKQKLYDKKFKDYCEKRGIHSPDSNDMYNFQDMELREFILNHPFSWIRLQFHKFFWEYGVLPESTSFRILMTGLLKGNTILVATVLLLPVMTIITLLILTFNLKRSIKKLKMEPPHLLMAIFLVYYLTATVFYYPYSERYRIPVMVCFWIPLLVDNLIDFRLKALVNNKKEMIIKALIFLIFAVNWSYEAYIIGIKNRGRYNKTLYEIQDKNVSESFYASPTLFQ